MGQVVDARELVRLVETAHTAGQRIVLTNGHFDLLHVGHLRYLNLARGLGDLLIVGVNSDSTTARRKGPRRPIVPEGERAELIAGLACVDFVVIFHEPTAEELVRQVRPSVYVKGGDYRAGDSGTGTPLPEADLVRALGGEVRIIPLEPGQSTSAIEQRIVERWLEHERADH